MVEIYKPTTNKELSQRKLEEYAKFEKILKLGRQNPIWFVEEFYGIALMDYQKWMFMESWYRPFVLWLCSRGAGKTAEAAVYLQAKMVLIPNSKWYINTNSASQSIEVFKKIEDIALQRIPSFKSCLVFSLITLAPQATSKTSSNPLSVIAVRITFISSAIENCP